MSNPNPNTAIIYGVLALGIGFAVRTLKKDTFVFPPSWHIPSAARPLLALLLGALGGGVDMMARGTPWKDALLQGLAAAITAMVGHAVLVEGARDGKEVALPFPEPGQAPPAGTGGGNVTVVNVVSTEKTPSALAEAESKLGAEELTPRQRLERGEVGLKSGSVEAAGGFAAGDPVG